MEDVAKFLFLGVGAVALFTFLTVTHWLTTRAAERRERERMALLRKVAEQPAETAGLIRELLREEDARVCEQARQAAARGRYDGLQGGAILLAVGVGLSIFLNAIAPEKPVWTLGIMIMLIGVVIAAFAYLNPHDSPSS